jgi:6-phosphogluconate dehydrogenase
MGRLTIAIGADVRSAGTMSEGRADIAVIGLAVMGQNLILNMNDHGFEVVAFNRTRERIEEFLAGPAAGRATIAGAQSLEDLVRLLRRPRKVMLMVKAGRPTDDFIEQLVPLLEPGDVIIDGGNANFHDTIRRTEYVEANGLLYVGTGVSGGEEGARYGPSIMPGGSLEAWPLVQEILQAIAAKTPDGAACCDWVGENGAGHYVKMTHNGIEYGDMQLICEAYHLLREGLELDPDEMVEVFARWNEGELDSYLIEITRDILGYRDENGDRVLDRILDTAGQKGTGKWTSVSSLDLGVPVTLIGEAVYARCLSALKDERVAASQVLGGPRAMHRREDSEHVPTDPRRVVDAIGQALLASKIVSYAQGFMLMRAAAAEFGWKLEYGAIALMWREGCIIRSRFLDRIKEAFDREPGLPSLLLDDYFRDLLKRCQPGWRGTVQLAIEQGIPVPALSSALAFYDGYRSDRLPANLLQAQRDFFGAHTYERLDRPRGEFFHTDWTGTGGAVASSTYSV